MKQKQSHKLKKLGNDIFEYTPSFSFPLNVVIENDETVDDDDDKMGKKMRQMKLGSLAEK